MCARYTVNCGIPLIQNRENDLAEVARCTILVSCLTDIDRYYCVGFMDRDDLAEVARCTIPVSRLTDVDRYYCVGFMDRVSVHLDNVHLTSKASKWFTPDFPVVSLYFAGL